MKSIKLFSFKLIVLIVLFGFLSSLPFDGIFQKVIIFFLTCNGLMISAFINRLFKSLLESEHTVQDIITNMKNKKR